MMRLLLTLAAVLMLAGCATRYQPDGFTGGYSELQLSQDTFRISVAGNAYTSTKKAEEIALLRAAELTLQRGFERFVVVGGDIQQRHAGTTPVYADRVGNSVVFSGGDRISKPRGSLTIRLVSKTDPEYAGAFEAKLIDAQLRPKLTD